MIQFFFFCVCVLFGFGIFIVNLAILSSVRVNRKLIDAGSTMWMDVTLQFEDQS